MLREYLRLWILKWDLPQLGKKEVGQLPKSTAALSQMELDSTQTPALHPESFYGPISGMLSIYLFAFTHTCTWSH